MAEPVVFDVPHRLGVEEAKRRMSGGVGDLERSIPGASSVKSRWQGDRMVIEVIALGQEVTANLDVFDSKVRMEVMLPGILGLMGEKVAGFFRRGATKMLEDKRPTS